jgi:type I restriction enzyme S subunit
MNDSNNRRAFYGFQIPNDWRLEKLGTFGETFTGLSGKTKEDFGSGKPYIPYLNIFNNAIIRDGDFDFVNIGENETQSVVQNGDLFFTTSSETPEEVGMCSVYLGNESELYLNSFCFGFRANSEDDISTEFTAQLFRSALGRRIIYKLAQGATRYNISKTNLLLEEIPLPPLPEQKAIANILSTADTAIHTTEKLIAQKVLRKKWLMQQLLTGKKRLKGFGGEWKKERLEKYLVKHDEKSTENNQYPVLTSSRRGIFLQSDYYTRDVASEDNTGYNVVPRGYFTYRHMSDDLIFKFNINDIVDKGIVSTLYPVFTTKDINSYFLLVKLNEGSEFKMHAEEQKQGGSRTYVYFKTLCQLKLNLPSVEEQNAIARVLQAADKEISLLKAKAEKLREQKKGLMQVLLTGKVRLNF